MAGTPPQAPPELSIYNSYGIDPQYARGFTALWTSALGVAILVSLPSVVRSIRTGRAYQGLGLWEDLQGQAYAPISDSENSPLPKPRSRRTVRPLMDWLTTKGNVLPPGLNLVVTQVLIIVVYIGALVFCTFHKVPIRENPNRPGFMSVAQLPVIFLFASKNGILSLLLGRGYEKLNFLHRWAGRAILVTTTIHGSLWIRNHLTQAPELMSGSKERYGMAAYGTLCLIVLSSLGPVRRAAYQLFFFCHVIGYVAFFIIVCYHTPYAVPWIFPAIAFYAADLLVRMVRFRFKDATVVAVDNQLTLVHVHDVDGGWIAGQHVRVRALFGGRVFESHPLTICTAPPSTSCSEQRGLLLGARVQGPWTRSLNALAAPHEKGARILVMLDGPYGGCGLDLGEFENVLLVAGGSGVTFTLGLLDDLVGRIVRHGRKHGEVTRRVEFAWCIRSFGTIAWFEPLLHDIARKAKGSSLDVHISVYVTCLCDPEAVPDIPNMDVTLDKPSMKSHLSLFLTPGGDKEAGSVAPGGGGLGIAVCGPSDLTREAQNTVARLSPAQMKLLGGVSLHTEQFCL